MIGFWRHHFMWLEPVVVLLLTAGLVWWIECGRGAVVVDSLLEGNRAAIYSALASVFGALLGFVLTAVSIVIGFSAMEQLAIVRDSPHYETLYRIYLHATWILAIATLFALVGLVADRDTRPVNVLLYLILLTSGIASVRVARCVWALEQVVMLVVRRPATKSPSPPKS